MLEKPTKMAEGNMQERTISQILSPLHQNVEWSALKAEKHHILNATPDIILIYKAMSFPRPASIQWTILFLWDKSTYFMQSLDSDKTWQCPNLKLMSNPQVLNGLTYKQELALTFFSLSTAECSLKTHTYSLPAFCWDLASRVAFSMHTIRQPVHYPCSY